VQVRQLKEEVDLEKQAHEQATRALNQAKADLARRTEQLENLTKGACTPLAGKYARHDG